MNTRTMLVLTVGLMALILLVMPSATAKFSLQHRFVNGSGVDCTKCHPSIHSEITSNNVHTTHGFKNNPCRGCHIPSYADGDVGGLPASSPYYNPYQGGTGKFHAAALVECTFCHFNNPECTSCHTKANVTAEFENSQVEAHRPLYWRAKNASGVDTGDLLRSSNEACIACHTKAANVTIIQPTQYLNITANFSDCRDGVDPNCYSGWNLRLDIS
ncbi:MAG: hypothetical protein GXO66_07105 [Euryarchaeota archaeon]|nr:hypothetical protein [Euryarchaeota archaeon]